MVPAVVVKLVAKQDTPPEFLLRVETTLPSR
jgi:hypothetical protein